jgi:hypothetical protein
MFCHHRIEKRLDARFISKETSGFFRIGEDNKVVRHSVAGSRDGVTDYITSPSSF